MKNLFPTKAWRSCGWLLSGMVFLGLGIGGLTAAPIVEYSYNETGTSVSNSGSAGGSSTLYNATHTATDLHSANGTGVSGLSGDRAFDLTSSPGVGSAGPYQKAGFISGIDSLKSFTLTGWFNTGKNATIASGARLIDFTGETANDGFVLWSSVAGALTLNVNGNASSSSSGNGTFGTENAWVFFAVTYDGTASTNNLKFYAGTTDTDPILASTQTLNEGTVGSVGSSSPLVIGNNFYTNRGFDGYMDNITVFGSKADATGVLDLTAIQTVYDNNLANIPEPGIVSLLALAGMSLALARSRRKQTAD